MIYTFKNLYGGVENNWDEGMTTISVSPNTPIITSRRENTLILYLNNINRELMFDEIKDARKAQEDIDLYSNYTREEHPEKFL